jgi:hypothetical protein
MQSQMPFTSELRNAPQPTCAACAHDGKNVARANLFEDMKKGS